MLLVFRNRQIGGQNDSVGLGCDDGAAVQIDRVDLNLTFCAPLGRLKTSVSVPLPDSKSANSPGRYASSGCPLTVTGSLNVTSTVSSCGVIFLIIGSVVRSGFHLPANVHSAVI